MTMENHNLLSRRLSCCYFCPFLPQSFFFFWNKYSFVFYFLLKNLWRNLYLRRLNVFFFFFSGVSFMTKVNFWFDIFLFFFIMNFKLKIISFFLQWTVPRILVSFFFVLLNLIKFLKNFKPFLHKNSNNNKY